MDEKWCPFTKTKCSDKCALYGVQKCSIAEAGESIALSNVAVSAAILKMDDVAKDVLRRFRKDGLI